MGLLTSCCRCGRRLTILGLGLGLPVVEACEFCRQAESTRPAAVKEQVVVQFHNREEADVKPLMETALSAITTTTPGPVGGWEALGPNRMPTPQAPAGCSDGVFVFVGSNAKA